MNKRPFSWKTAAFIFWPLLILAGLVILRFTYEGARTGEGASLYQTRCANCHGPKGEGFKQLYPPLTGAPVVAGDGAAFACLVYRGSDQPLVVGGVTYTQPMPGNPDLSVAQVTAIVNFVRGAWGNGLAAIRAQEIELALKQCKP